MEAVKSGDLQQAAVLFERFHKRIFNFLARMTMDHGYRMDLLVENKVVIETKTVEFFTDVHFAQVLTYFRLGNYKLGLLINFQVALLKNGIKKIIN